MLLEKRKMIEEELKDFFLASEERETFLNYFLHFFVKPRMRNIKDLKIERNNEEVLVGLKYLLINVATEIEINMQFSITNKFRYRVSGIAPSRYFEKLKRELYALIYNYRFTRGKRSLYLSLFEGSKSSPETSKPPGSYGMYSKNLVGIYMTIFGLFFFLFYLLGFYALVALLLIQFFLFYSSDKSLFNLSTWKVTQENKRLWILKIAVPMEKFRDFYQQNFPKLKTLKEEIINRVYTPKGEISKEDVSEIIKEKEINLYGGEIEVKPINILNVVKGVSSKLKVKTPKIGLINTPLPNAAATGPSQHKSTIVITTGLLSFSDEEELENIVAHELGHIKNKDPLSLLLLSLFVESLRLIVFFTYFSIIAFMYFFLGVTLVYFFAKIFEIRADLEAIKHLKQPKTFANILRKIMFRTGFPYRKSFLAWFNWDPHPPIYFRIKMMEEFARKKEIEEKNSTIQAFKELFKGFFADLFDKTF